MKEVCCKFLSKLFFLFFFLTISFFYSSEMMVEGPIMPVGVEQESSDTLPVSPILKSDSQVGPTSAVAAPTVSRDSLEGLLLNAAKPDLSFSEKLTLYENGLTTFIKLETPWSSKQNFLTSLKNFISFAIASSQPTVEELGRLLLLYNRVLVNQSFTPDQKKKFKEGKKDKDISKKKAIQEAFQNNLTAIAALDFDKQLKEYSRTLKKQLNKNINYQNRQNLVNALGHLVSVAKTDAAKKVKAKDLLFGAMDNKYFFEKQKEQIWASLVQLGGIPAASQPPQMMSAVDVALAATSSGATTPKKEHSPELEQAIDDVDFKFRKSPRLSDKFESIKTALPLITDKVEQSQKNRLVAFFPVLFGARANMRKEQLAALLVLFQRSQENQNLLDEAQKKVMEEWIKEVKAAYQVTKEAYVVFNDGIDRTVHPTYLQSFMLDAEAREPLAKIKMFRRVLFLLTQYTSVREIRKLVIKLNDFYRRRKKMEYEVLEVLSDLFEKSLNNRFIRPSLKKNFPKYVADVERLYFLRSIVKKEDINAQIAACEQVLPMLDRRTDTDEKELFFQALTKLFENKSQMNIKLHTKFMALLQSVVAKAGLFTGAQNNTINTWINQISVALARLERSRVTDQIDMQLEACKSDSFYLKTLLDVAATERNYTRAFINFSRAFDLFKKRPDRSFAGKFVPALNNMWSNRARAGVVLPRVKQIFEQMYQRDDILVTNAQKDMMKKWLQDIDKNYKA